MGKIITFLLLLFLCSRVEANIYYFSSSAGNDSWPGTEAQPFQSMAKLQSVFNSANTGDVLLLHRGEVFPTFLLNLNRSGVTIDAYGTGARPIISSFATLANFTNQGGNIWSASYPLTSRLNIVTVGGVGANVGHIVDRGRYPNITDSARGFKPYNYGYPTLLVAPPLPIPAENWIGGEIVFRSVPWIINHYTIQPNSSGGQFYMNGTKTECAAGPLDHFGYFIMNHIGTLDQQNEWYFDGSALKMYSTVNPNTLGVKIATADTLVKVRGNNNTFRNISFQGANGVLMYAAQCVGLKTLNVEFLKSGGTGLKGDGCSYSTVDSFLVQHANYRGIDFSPYSYRDTIRNGAVDSTSMFYTLMGNGNAANLGVMLGAADSPGVYVQHVKITNSAYNGLSLYGTGSVIENSSDMACSRTDDGAAFYTADSGTKGRYFIGNIALNTLGSHYGSNHDSTQNEANMYGADDRSEYVWFIHNFGKKSTREALGLHNNNHITVTDNTFIDAKMVLMRAAHDNNEPDYPTRAVNVWGNTFVSLSGKPSYNPINRLSYNAPWHFSTRRDETDAFGFGTSGNNSYWKPNGANFPTIFRFTHRVIPPGADCTGCNPADSSYRFDVERLLTLEELQRQTGLEKGSRIGRYYAPYTSINLGPEMYPNGNFNVNANDIRGNNYSWVANGIKGGSLKVTYPSPTKPGSAQILFYREGTTNTFFAGHQYRIKFSVQCGGEHIPFRMMMYSDSGPGGNGNFSFTDSTNFEAGLFRKDVEFFYSPPATVDVAYFSLTADSAYNAQWFLVDNMSMREVNGITYAPDPTLTLLNPDDTPKVFTTDGTYIDEKGKPVGTKITVLGHDWKLLFKNPSVFQATNGRFKFTP